jgi:hypothetical protein
MDWARPSAVQPRECVLQQALMVVSMLLANVFLFSSSATQRKLPATLSSLARTTSGASKLPRIRWACLTTSEHRQLVKERRHALDDSTRRAPVVLCDDCVLV